MVTEDGTLVPPPNGDAETTMLSHVWTKVDTETASKWPPRLRTRRARIGAAAIAAVLLFSGGVAVGGASLAPLTKQSPAFAVACYPSQTATKTSVQLSYSTEQDAAVARSNPVNACGHVQTLTNVENGIDDLVRRQIAQGHTCGAIHLTDGTTWSFIDDPTNGLTVESATPVPALGSNCIQLRNVQPPATSAPKQLACTVNDQLVNVYPGDPKDAGAVCAAKGMTAAG